MDFKKLMLGTKGKIFRVDFIKRTNGQFRRMVARTGVRKGVQEPGRFRERDNAQGLLRVFDMQKGGFRCIPLESVLSVKAFGIVHVKELVL